jgi:hypothetical protein
MTSASIVVRGALTVAVACLLPAVAAGQRAATTARAASAANGPKTAWGDPDLQGIWSNTTTTPLERPADASRTGRPPSLVRSSPTTNSGTSEAR